MRLIRILTVCSFILLVVLGFCAAFNRPLWNDEYYSLISSTLNTSYKVILTGGVSEGNNSPLFYFLQKLQCDLFSYHPPKEWVNGSWNGVHSFDQIFLRAQAVVFMSAALSALFYYFSRRNSLLGVYALAVTMTSSLFWFHWTEARPYAEWFSLTLFQILILLNILEVSIERNKKSLGYLIVVHWLLALTSFISIVQIMAAGIVLWVFQRPKSVLFIPLVLIPFGVCTFYYIHAPHYSFFFINGPWSLINANVPKDRLFLIFLSAVILVFRCRRKNWAAHLEMKYLAFFILILGAFGLILLKLKYSQSEVRQGFQISSRYFLSLDPAGIVGTVLFSEYLIRAFPSRAWKTAAALILVGCFIFRLHKVTQPEYTKLKWFFLKS